MRVAAGLVAGLVCSTVLAGAPAPRTLTFDDRVKAQTAIERVYYAHQVGATKKFEDAVPSAVVQAKVQKYLEESAALSVFWKTAVTDLTLQRELERMAQGTRMPERLQELYAALGNDPFLVKECLARPALVDRLTHNFQAFDSTLHIKEKAQADALYAQLVSGALSPSAENPNRTVTEVAVAASDSAPAPTEQSPQPKLTPEDFKKFRADFPTQPSQVSNVKETRAAFTMSVVLSETKTTLRVANYVVPKTSWEAWWSDALLKVSGDSVVAVASAGESLTAPKSKAAVCAADDTWDNGILDDPEVGRVGHSAVWSGNVMLVWGGTQADFAVLSTGRRYDPATDTWASLSTVGAPSARTNHTAVWTGSAMVVWGGGDTSHVGDFNTGGRYDPITDVWVPMSVVNAPSARFGHTAVWTGQVMIVWGGRVGEHDQRFNTGGRYNPLADTWDPTSIIGAPTGSEQHTAVWTGHVMIVCGAGSHARYDPGTDTWLPISITGAPPTILGHTAVWDGSEMLIWGGLTTVDLQWHPTNEGARYNPDSDTWTAMSTDGAPSPRVNASGVWTGTRMLAWGGDNWSSTVPFGDGGTYDPGSDSWAPISPAGAPSARTHHSVIWTGTAMVVWGGDSNGPSNTGGRYDPATNAWTPTFSGEFLSGRSQHVAVWTGNVAIVWGGTGESGDFDTGGRYDPGLDLWTSTSIVGAPTSRVRAAAVWTGTEMIVWGGHATPGSVPLGTGRRYNPIADTWVPVSNSQAPIARANFSAVWTGNRMLIWGGYDGSAAYLNTGGQYDPATDTWTTISISGAPSSRAGHSASWLDEQMVIWGGGGYDGETNTGGRYDPITDLWTATSQIGAPSGRDSHTAVSTGSLMVVWGGFDGNVRSTGGRYDPAADLWLPTSSIAVPTARLSHTAVWTGAEMVIWGGSSFGGHLTNTGARYNPTTDTWVPTATIGAPSPRAGHTAVWTGSLMMVWGGSGNGYLDSGGRYVLGASVDNDHDGFTECQGDCNDANPLVNPNAHEICDGIDNDCNGVVDDDPEVLCNDGNSCTDDSCDPAKGCVHVDNVAPCDDGNSCTSNDTCNEGICIGHSGCEDGLPCTDDRADPANGCACSNPVSPQGTPCIDGNQCTLRTVCDGAGGAAANCRGGTLLDCNDNDPCTDDACDPATGCVNSCDDGNVCTTGDACTPRGLVTENFDGVTPPALPPGWSSIVVGTGTVWATQNSNSDTAPNSAVGIDSEGIADEVLETPTIAIASSMAKLTFRNRWSFQNDRDCFDGSVLEIKIGAGTYADIVDAGGSFITGGYTGTVSPYHGNPLASRYAWCNKSSGYPDYLTTAVNLPATAAGQAIRLRWRLGSDGSGVGVGQDIDSIVISDPANVCAGGATRDCDDNNPCTDDSCDPASGCVNANNTNSCEDGNACTTGDNCSGGSCHAGASIVCNDNNSCTSDTCNPATGCTYTNNTNSCGDGNACTGGGVCSGGTCHAGTPIVCAPADACHTAGVCDPATGTCSSVNAPDGTACSDNNLCTAGDSCRAGICIAASNGLNHPRPNSAGYYKQLCDHGRAHDHTVYHGDVLTDPDALCVAGLTATFDYLQTADDICNVLEDDNGSGGHGGRHHGGNGNGPNGHDCDKAEDELIATALNICRARVCLVQDLDSHCHGNTHTTVAQSFADGDAILDTPSRDQHTCNAARCELREINNGHALEMNSLVLSMDAGKVRLTWALPVMDDGAATPSYYELWRRPMGSGDDFTKIGQARGLSFVDGSAGTALWEYDVSAVMP